MDVLGWPMSGDEPTGSLCLVQSNKFPSDKAGVRFLSAVEHMATL